MIHNKNIICVSSIDWDFVWQGHQEIMNTFACHGNRVLFIENTGIRAGVIKCANANATFHEQEAKVFRAASQTQSETQAGLPLHPYLDRDNNPPLTAVDNYLKIYEKTNDVMYANLKAKELVLTYGSKLSYCMLRIEPLTILSKQCALNCVDEIITLLKFVVIDDVKHKQNLKRLNYYDEVKQEINKL